MSVKRTSVLFLSILLLSIIVIVLACSPVRTTPSFDGNPIRYTQQGSGKPALVFVHCWCGDKSYWDNQVPIFSQNYRVVTLDLAGHGESGADRQDWTMEAFGKDVVAVVEKLDLQQVILIGHSMGDAVIFEAARRIPDRVIGLVGVDNMRNFEREIPAEQINQFVAQLGENFIENASEFVRSFFPADADSALVEHIATDMASAPPEIGLSAMTHLLNYMYKEALKEIHVPIRCINSDRYPTNVEANQKHTVSFEARIMPGIGHFGQLEDPETFNRLLAETIVELSGMATQK